MTTKSSNSIAIAFALVILLVLGCTRSHEAKVSKVTVRDSESNVIREITNVEDLARFDQLWEKRATLSGGPDAWWPFKLDIERNGRSERWLYQPNGVVRILSVKETPAYRFEQPEEVRRLLGV